ncbi:hypothetical protein LAZ67_10001194 [Cordylochernes scorpioides]|uniref:Transposase n=1 Tax=Cordylochernes scorpioides TaxID=51811 RepID=A0ABY6KVM6_9ARAC|nr:hypothetical protein LAZ67_10001194 [Cordylochernes scorpioides]
MVWKKPEESAPKKVKVTISAGKVMAIVFWDCKGVLLVDYLPPNTTVNACEVLRSPVKIVERDDNPFSRDHYKDDAIWAHRVEASVKESTQKKRHVFSYPAHKNTMGSQMTRLKSGNQRLLFSWEDRTGACPSCSVPVMCSIRFPFLQALGFDSTEESFLSSWVADSLASGRPRAPDFARESGSSFPGIPM